MRQLNATELSMELIKKFNLNMKSIETEFTFDRKKLIFYFASEDRVDFRELVKAVKAFSSDIKIAKGGKAMNCKAIFGIMGLAVKKGDEVTLTFEGADEDAAYEAVSKFMQETL